MKKEQSDLVRAWLVKAQKDLFVAQDTLKYGAEYTDVTCFHAQQAAEKSLKAYLVWLEIEFPKTHVLGDLLDLIGQRDTILESHREAIESLTPFAVEARYPEFFLPTLIEAKEAVETAVQVLDRVKSALPKECLPS